MAPRALELKVPPVVLVLTTALLMWIGARVSAPLTLALPVRRVGAVGLALLGIAICAMGLASFRRARTTVNPMTPEASSVLVRSGVYRLTRNPMYLGFALVLLAWGVFLANGLALAPLAGFVLYMNRFQIEPEERALAATFGQEFADYTSRVRRWL